MFLVTECVRGAGARWRRKCCMPGRQGSPPQILSFGRARWVGLATRMLFVRYLSLSGLACSGASVGLNWPFPLHVGCCPRRCNFTGQKDGVSTLQHTGCTPSGPTVPPIPFSQFAAAPGAAEARSRSMSLPPASMVEELKCYTNVYCSTSYDAGAGAAKKGGYHDKFPENTALAKKKRLLERGREGGPRRARALNVCRAASGRNKKTRWMRRFQKGAGSSLHLAVLRLAARAQHPMPSRCRRCCCRPCLLGWRRPSAALTPPSSPPLPLPPPRAAPRRRWGG